MKFNVFLTFFLTFLLLIFITPTYAFSFNDIVSWISDVFGRITGYATNVTTDCPYECCLNDPTYTDKLCQYPRTCKDYKCIDVETTTTTTTVPAQLKEQVKCVFLNANSEQKCFTDNWKFSCAGFGACAVDVYGTQGTKLLWKSSCGGEVYTVIDAYNEVVEFKCEVITTTTQPKIPIQPITTVPSTCTESDGGANYYVKGIVKDQFGEKTDYCNNEKELFEFWCKDSAIYAATISCSAGCKDGACLPENIQPLTTTQPQTKTPIPASIIKEQVTCVFENSESTQTCNSDDGRFGCSGIGRCIVEVSGVYGIQLTWKSSCGGYAYTIIDENNGYAIFNCAPSTTPTPSEVTEQVKCVFANSNDPQACYASNRFGCKGIGTCIAGVSGQQGEKLEWKSSCGGYAYTVIDGNNEYAGFTCQQVTTPIPVETPISVEIIREQVKCLFSNSVSTQKCVCDIPGVECEGIGSCVADVSGERGRRLTWKSTCGGYAYTVIDGNDEYAEFMCEQLATPSEPQIVKEQVKCIFHNSKVLTYPHTTTEECYTDDGRFACKWDGNVAEEDRNGESYRYAYCVAVISGERGTKLTWKSTCGGYAYTVLDGGEENAEFQCIPDINVTKDQISGKGFKKAYFQCYDGTEQTPVAGTTTQCWTAEYWQEHAKNVCLDNCRKFENLDITKCGVNSFSVSEECYIGEEGTVFIPPEQVGKGGGKKIAMEPDSKPGDLLLVYFYMKDCPYCEGMDEELDKVLKELGIAIMKIDANAEPELIKSYGIVGFPSLLLLEYTPNGIREYILSGKADSSVIIEWIGKVKGSAIVVPETPKEEMLICKDACPLEGKCYPFGYRKGGKFCSDDGAFKEQLKEDVTCENNFECETNVCVDGKCMSSGVIQKIISFFKQLFGL